MEFGQNNTMGFFGQPVTGTGYQWNPNAQQQTKQMNVLTADEIQTLMKTENKFTLALTQQEKLKAACTHRRADGLGDTLVDNSDGTVSCQICGYTFKPVDPATSGEDYLNAAVTEIVDILQTIKMLWIDVDAQVMREYSQIIPLIEKIPTLYGIAVKNYSNHENYNNWNYTGKNMSTLQMFGLLSGILQGAGAPNQQFGPAPQPVPQQATPNYYQQPNYGPGYYGAPGYGNPFGGYGAPNGYVPNTAGYAYQPGAPVPPQNPVETTATEVPTADATTSDATTTTKTFKA